MVSKYSREYKQENTVVNVNGTLIGGEKLVFIAGPCSLESKEQLHDITGELVQIGTEIIRAGLFKPRTSPYSFKGIGLEGLKILDEVKKEFNVNVVSEITNVSDLPSFLEHVDIIQVGARNMQNFVLLEELGKTQKPILLKRGFGATIEELLLASEYILANGNPNVILCERGIRTFEKSTRYTLDISSIPVIKKLSHLPIIVDPSHAAGNYEFVEALAAASIAAGADGLLVEVHNHPSQALSDKEQALKIDRYKNLVTKLNKIAVAIGRKV